MSISSIWPQNRIVTGASTPDQSGPGSDDNEGYSFFPKAPPFVKPHHQSVWCHIQVNHWRGLTLCKDAVGVFCSNSWLGQMIILRNSFSVAVAIEKGAFELLYTVVGQLTYVPTYCQNGLIVCRLSVRKGFIPKLSYTKDSKMVSNASLLNTQLHKIRIKSKWNNTRKGVVKSA